LVVLENLLGTHDVLCEVVLQQVAYALLGLLQCLGVILHGLLEDLIEILFVFRIYLFRLRRQLLLGQFLDDSFFARLHQTILSQNYRSKSLKSLAKRALSSEYCGVFL
jgi:hypothetical protein